MLVWRGHPCPRNTYAEVPVGPALLPANAHTEFVWGGHSCPPTLIENDSAGWDRGTL